MQSFNDTNAVWDLPLSQSLPSIADDEFIALLQKQFGVNQDQLDRNLFSPIKDASAAPPLANVDPQSLTTRLPTPPATSTPSSEDSSPSPPSMPADAASGSRSKRQSGVYAYDAGSGARNNDRSSDDEPAPKRKAGSEDHDDEPDPKAQHTSSASKKASGSRRKSTGNPDESRLMKRKEQNRAAQRAFRERKEKHVKDLEDKVAALEEKNSEAVAENESLREVITRLQSENMRLRSSSFTFSMPSGADKQTPKDTTPAPSSSGVHRQQSQQDSPMTMFNSPPSVTSSTTASTHDSPQSLFINDQNDGGSLSFLNSGLRVLDSEPQQTATAAADSMSLDFGFGPIMTQPYTTIASNPMFMSFREPDQFSFDQANNLGSTYAPANQMSNMQPFDFSQAFSSWPDVNMDDVQLNGTFDELFGGASYLGQLGGNDFNFNKSPAASLSPVSHHNSNKSSSASITSGSSSSGSTPASISSNAASPTNGAEASMSSLCPNNTACSKANIEDALARDPGSMFAPRPDASSSANPPAQNLEMDACPEEVPCKGLKLPKTQRSEKNVEVMNAWRAIRHDPNYQDADINSLCSEFASKAKCDGCQVVLEPEGLQEILDLVAKQKMSKQSALNGSSSSINKATSVTTQ